MARGSARSKVNSGALVGAILFFSGWNGELHGQERARITERPDNSVVVRLIHTTHPAVGEARDLGRVAPNLAMERILLQLQSSPEQEDALEQLLAEQQDISSPRYHAWLTPEEFGEQFGVARQDLDAVVAWLTSAGFQVTEIAPGRRTIEFGGTVGDVERAFHTEMHNFDVNGERHIANSTDLSIPEALARVVEGVSPLNDFRARPMHHMVQAAPGTRGGPSEGPSPQTELGNGAHGISPYDFAAIYDVSGLWSANYDGTGQSIAVLGETNIKLSDVAGFRSMFGLPANQPQIILNGKDPGDVGGVLETEADLDVEWAGAVAKGATVKYVASASSLTSAGITLSAQYAVSNNVASVITVSFGLCEASMGMSNQIYNGMWQQAAAQGISVFVAAGDSGSAGCDTPSQTTPARDGFGVNGLGSSSYNVSVGGTEFSDTASPSTYWNASNSGNLASAKGYIPEVVWNESSYTGVGVASNNLYAGGGGASNQWPRPAWQTGAGVPAGTFRLTPDISLTAAVHDGYLIEQEGGLYLVAGTSASTPSFAGIMAILNQYTGARNGNPNARFYSLATSTPSTYHDITTGSNAVPCAGGSPNCSAGLPETNVGKMTGYSAGPGYDLATGLGSVDAYALARGWGGAQVAPTITSLSPNPMKGSNTAQALTVNGTGFVAGLSIKVGTLTYGPSQLTSVSSTRVVLNVTVGTAAQNPAVEAINTTGPVSNTATLQVTGPPPAIGALSPDPMPGSNSGQVLTIAGTGFQSGLTLQIGSTKLTSSQLMSVTATQIQVNLIVGLTTRAFAVTVTNPDGQVSGSVNFQVNAPPAPSITSLSPSQMTGSNAAQTLTINGSNFQPGTGLTVLVGATNYTGSQVTFVSGSQIKVSVVMGVGAKTLNVRVTNPSGMASNTVTLTVK